MTAASGRVSSVEAVPDREDDSRPHKEDRDREDQTDSEQDEIGEDGRRDPKDGCPEARRGRGPVLFGLVLIRDERAGNQAGARAGAVAGAIGSMA
jgi:hypothetical protein